LFLLNRFELFFFLCFFSNLCLETLLGFPLSVAKTKFSFVSQSFFFQLNYHALAKVEKRQFILLPLISNQSEFHSFGRILRSRFVEPILRLLNLQLQRQPCSGLERVFKIDDNIFVFKAHSRRCKFLQRCNSRLGPGRSI
jgi:hypothetical protein